MTIAVSIGGVGFDHSEALASEQRRIAQYLTFASPRDIDDLSQVMSYSWSSGAGQNPSGDKGPTLNLNVTTQFPTFVQVSFGPLGQPVYNMFLRDDNGDLHSLSDGTGSRNRLVVTPGNNATLPTSAQLGAAAKVGTSSGADTVIQAGDVIIPNATPIVVGRVKFEAESGLALASINLRIAEINNVIESLAKVLSVQGDLFNAASGLVR